MTLLEGLRLISPKKVIARFDTLLYFFSLYAIPAVIVIFSVLVVSAAQNRFMPEDGEPLPFQLLSLPALASPQDALRELRLSPTTVRTGIAATESPSWFLFNITAHSSFTNPVIEIPSLHTQTIACWNATTLTSLGYASRDTSTGLLRPARLGFYITAISLDLPVSILCRATVSAATYWSMLIGPAEQLETSISQFHHSTGVLEGGLLTIALFILVIAFINRESRYFLLAAWLVGSLRLGAMAMGWDTQWLGQTIPYAWLPLTRQVTIAVYYLLTYVLFIQLFRADLGRLDYPRLLRSVPWAGVILFAAALTLPHGVFQPIMWLITTYGLLIAIYILGYILYTTRSKAALWYSVSLGMAVCTVLAAVLEITWSGFEFAGVFNSVIALLASNIIAALIIAEQMRAEHKDKIQAQVDLANHYAAAPIGMFTINSQGIIERANPVFEKLLGLPSNEYRNARWTDYFPPQDWQQLAHDCRHGEGPEIMMHSSVGNTAQPRHFIVNATLLKDKVEGSLQDITDQTNTIRQLQLLADNDPLTDVLNRRGIEKALNTSLEALANGEPCALAYLDLDHFRRINGLFGHSTGDEVLKQVCERIKEILCAAEQIGRIGGNEFIILFPGATVAQAKQASQDIIKSLQTEAFQVGPRAFQIQGAIGVVEVTPGMQAKDAISAAHRACRDAQKSHVDIVAYEQSSNELQEHTEELRLFDELEGGESPRGLYLEMQPIMSLKAPLETLNFEVLLRVRDSTGALIPTGKIISAAEESGTITIIDKWVFSATLEWLDKHQSRLQKTRFVCINLSGVSLNDEKFVDAFFDILTRYEHLVDRLCVEITEGVALHDLNKTRQFMRRLQGMGARIALDDFGAGYTSFSYLRSLPTNAIKIDGALIKDMMANPTNVAIVGTIVELARNLGMVSIVEWVEDCATLEALWKMDVDYVQGYLVAKAQPPANILNASSLTDLIESTEALTLIKNTLSRQHSARF